MKVNLNLNSKRIEETTIKSQYSPNEFSLPIDTYVSTEDITAGNKMDPLNIDLLMLTSDVIRRLGQVKSKDIYEQNSTVFKKDGLFSTEIFGPTGSKERLKRFGYIDIGLKIFHPRIYKELITLNSLYKDLLAGKRYAKFDTKLKDFVETDKLEGDTGYLFFFKHFDEIKFVPNQSTQRLFKILFLKKYKLQDTTLDKYLVIPAGIRDYIVTESGKVLENEINNLYRKLLTVANTAQQFKHETRDIEFINQIRVRLQKVVVEIYDYLESMLDGKSKFIQGKWTKRAIFYGTRNVITGVPKPLTNLKDDTHITAITTYIGPLQAAKGILPITIYELRTRFLNKVFDIENNKSNIIDIKTLTRKPMTISEKTRSQWVTDDGLEKIINKMLQADLLMSDIIIENKAYLFLILDKDNEIVVIDNITDVPDEDKQYVRPMKYIELLYLTLFNTILKYKGLLTRYPVTGYGSTVIVELLLKSTTETRKVKVRLSRIGEEIIAPEYPIFKNNITPFYSLSIPTIYLEGLSADFDGYKK